MRKFQVDVNIVELNSTGLMAAVGFSDQLRITQIFMDELNVRFLALLLIYYILLLFLHLVLFLILPFLLFFLAPHSALIPFSNSF